jgi:hypothetical protein
MYVCMYVCNGKSGWMWTYVPTDGRNSTPLLDYFEWTHTSQKREGREAFFEIKWTRNHPSILTQHNTTQLEGVGNYKIRSFQKII